MRWCRPLPWASLIALGIETRSWPAPARLVYRTIPALCPLRPVRSGRNGDEMLRLPEEVCGRRACGRVAAASRRSGARWPAEPCGPRRARLDASSPFRWKGPAMHRFRRGRHQLSGNRRRRGSPAAEFPGVSPVSPRPRRSAAPSGSDRSRGRRAGSRRRRARG